MFLNWANRIFVFLLGMALLSGCGPVKTKTSQLNHLGFEISSSLKDSIGAFSTSKDADLPDHYGTGFIIAEDDSSYIGMTNDHVWSAHSSDPEELKHAPAYLAFPTNDEQTEWDYFEAHALLDNNSERIFLYELNLDGLKTFDVAFFKIEKKNYKRKLKPLSLTSNLEDVRPTESMVVGYPGMLARPGEIMSQTTLVKSSGVAWKVDQKRVKVDLGSDGLDIGPIGAGHYVVTTAQLKEGNSGSPLFIKGKTSHDGEDEWKVAGIVFTANPDGLVGNTYPGSDRSAARSREGFTSGAWAVSLLSHMRERFPDSNLWNILKIDDTFLPIHAEPIAIDAAAYETKTIDGQATKLVRLNISSWMPNPEYLYINGVKPKYIDGYKVESAQMQFQLPIMRDQFKVETPEIILEYVDPAVAHSFFVGCAGPSIFQEVKLDQTYSLRCQLQPDRKLVFGDSMLGVVP